MIGEGEDAWVLVVIDGKVQKRRPWCDCTRQQQIAALGTRRAMTVGFIKGADGLWVRPCCLRRERLVWLKYRFDPVPAKPLT